MLSTVRNVRLLELRNRVDWVVEFPPPNRPSIDFTVLTIGGSSHEYLLPLLSAAGFFTDFV